jgi:hypothetical protein
MRRGFASLLREYDMGGSELPPSAGFRGFACGSARNDGVFAQNDNAFQIV